MKTACALKSIVMLGLVGAAAGVANAQTPTVPYPVNITGATLFESFFAAPQSTIDAIDADGNGRARLVGCGGIILAAQQLAPQGVQPGVPWWALQYRAVGSGNGLQELVNYGTRFAINPNDIAQSAAAGLENAYCNRTKWFDNTTSGLTGIANTGNPGAAPFRSDTSSLLSVYAAPNTPAAGGVRFDAAIMDVPTKWFVRNTTGPAFPGNMPTAPGYGNSLRFAVNKDGTITTQSNRVRNLTSSDSLVSLNTNTASPDANTVFDTPIAAAPIAFMVNYGAGHQQMTYTQLRHLYATGRLPSGENLTMITRDVGSGTRNGSANSIGLDPSFAAGENVGVKNDDVASDPNNRSFCGPDFLPSNKGGSGSLERAVLNCRLAVGTSGAERGKTQNWLAQHRCELLGVQNDLAGGTRFARPDIDSLLDNDINGYNIEGPETFATIGDPRANAPADGGLGWVGASDPFLDGTNGFPADGVYQLGESFTDLNANGLRDTCNAEAGLTNSNPAMRSPYGAQYVNNISRSIEAYANSGAAAADFTPGELLAQTFILVAATDNVPTPTDPKNVIPNAKLNQTLQDTIRSINTIYTEAYYDAFNSGFAGIVPQRKSLTSGTYSDGSTALYRLNGAGGSSTITAGSQVPLRNKISFDFSGDGVRDINDTADMIGAWKRYNMGGAWTAPDGIYGAGAGALLSIDLIGDGNNDGSFTAADVRYAADGLLTSAGRVDRKAAFTAVDAAFGGNFFGTTLAHGTYANGGARGDVAGALGTTPGFAPVGFDGVVDAKDIDYVYKQFKTNAAAIGGAVTWATNLNAAVNADFSADITGDGIIDQNDISGSGGLLEILETTLGDVNLDGSVDATDLAIANSHLNQSGGWALGDVNGDGTITQADLDIISAPTPCVTDINGDGNTDQGDVDCIISAAAGDPSCLRTDVFFSIDLNSDGNIDQGDVDALIDIVAGGPCNQ